MMSHRTLREGIDDFLRSTGFTPFSQPKLILHEAMHVIADATSGSVADEGRAIIAEYAILGGPTAEVRQKEDGSFAPFTREYSAWEGKAMAVQFMRKAQGSLDIEIDTEKTRLIAALPPQNNDIIEYARNRLARGSYLAFDELPHILAKFSPRDRKHLATAFGDSAKIKSFTRAKTTPALSMQELDAEHARLSLVGKFFAATHQGRDILSFPVTELLQMPLTAFRPAA